MVFGNGVKNIQAAAYNGAYGSLNKKGKKTTRPSLGCSCCGLSCEKIG